MILRIENVGPLRQAEVDLSKRLIVLTGPNNTGKTYLAWSTYGLHRFSPEERAPFTELCAEMLLTSPGYEVDFGALPGDGYRELIASVMESFCGSIHHCFRSTGC